MYGFLKLENHPKFIYIGRISITSGELPFSRIFLSIRNSLHKAPHIWRPQGPIVNTQLSGQTPLGKAGPPISDIQTVFTSRVS